MWLTLLAITAGFAAIAFFVAPGENRAPPLPPEFRAEPDVYLEDGVITQYRGDGTLHYRLNVSRAAHFDRDGADAFTEIESPVLELHHSRTTPETAPWRMRSQRGVIRSASTDSVDEADVAQEITLLGDVHLRQDRGAGGFTEVRTAALVVYPARQFAKSEQPVMIVTEAGNASAASLEADLRSGRMKLVSSTSQRVSIVVQPDQPRP